MTPPSGPLLAQLLSDGAITSGVIVYVGVVETEVGVDVEVTWVSAGAQPEELARDKNMSNNKYMLRFIVVR